VPGIPHHIRKLRAVANVLKLLNLVAPGRWCDWGHKVEEGVLPGKKREAIADCLQHIQNVTSTLGTGIVKL